MIALAGRNGVNDKYDDAGILIRPTVKLESEMELNEFSECCTCGYKWKTGQDGSHSCSQHLIKKLELAEAENARLQSEIDAANAQGPVIRVRDGRVVDFNPNYDGDVSNGEFFARPIPAQQPPAVAVPDDWEQSILDAMDEGFSVRRELGNLADGGLVNDDTQLGVEFAISHIKSLITKGVIVQSPHITEQDDISIIEQLVNDLYSEIEARFTPETLKYESMKRKYDNDMDTVNRGRALLEKLNKPDSAGG